MREKSCVQRSENSLQDFYLCGVKMRFSRCYFKPILLYLCEKLLFALLQLQAQLVHLLAQLVRLWLVHVSLCHQALRKTEISAWQKIIGCTPIFTRCTAFWSYSINLTINGPNTMAQIIYIFIFVLIFLVSWLRFSLDRQFLLRGVLMKPLKRFSFILVRKHI